MGVNRVEKSAQQVKRAKRVVRSLKQVLTVVGLGGLFVFSTSVAIYLAMHQPQVKAPSLIGLPLPQAQEMTRRLGLELQVKSRRHDDRYPADTVLDQWPPSGMTIKRGQALRVVLNQGPRSAETVLAPVETQPMPSGTPTSTPAMTPPPAKTAAPSPPTMTPAPVATEPRPPAAAEKAVEEAAKPSEPVTAAPRATPAPTPSTQGPDKPTEPAPLVKRPGKQGERRPGSHE